MDAKVEMILAVLAREAGAHPKLGGSLRIDFGEAGAILIDDANTVSDGTGKSADCTVSLSLDTFDQLRARTLDPTAAFFKGKLRISGDFALAMKLGPILQSAEAKH
jgi:putative sterol carrier protein